MEKDLKDLLIKDLCARLPYGVKGIEANSICLLNTSTHFKSLIKNIEYKIDHLGFKPYLFPLSSMTDEQKKEFDQCIELELKAINDEIDPTHATAFEVDFYNKHHFDWRGLIPLGLAIDATGLNIY